MKPSELLNDFLSLAFPAICEACHSPLVKGEELLCTACLVSLPRLSKQQVEEVENRMRLRVKIEHLAVWLKFSKGGVTQEILHALKYQDRPQLAYRTGKHFAHLLRGEPVSKHVELIIPVPLHRRKRIQRGYNQTEAIAKGISESLNIPAEFDALVRATHTSSQTRKSRFERWRNVDEVFQVKNPDLVKGKRILIVDDVVTTGSTIEASANALLEAGCLSVSAACLAAA